MSFYKEENQRAREHDLKLMELFMSQRQPAVSYSAGPSSMISTGRSPSPFAGPTILVKNLETLVAVSPSPMLIWVSQWSQYFKKRVAEHWGGRRHISVGKTV